MRTEFLALLCALAALGICSGCGTAPASQTAMATANVDAAQFKLAEEPEGAMGVIDALESAEDGAPLVLVGRVGGSANPWIEGRAAFTLIDASMNVVAEGQESAQGEICTGDCCATERHKCTTLVKVVNTQGDLVPVDTRELLGLKESDMVVLKGTAKRDKTGNFVMLAKGVYVRK
jgi:hypothetical protein